MHKIIEEYIKGKEAEKRKVIEKQKKRFLSEHNLFVKEYSDSDSYNSEYPYSEYDAETRKYRYYKTSEIQITDEEFELLKSYEVVSNPKNTIATILDVLAVVILIIGTLAGLIILDEDPESIGLTLMISSWVTAIFVAGFAEIIALLHKISQKFDKFKK